MSDYSATTNAYMNLASQKADLAYKNQYMQMGGAYNPTTNSVFANTGTNAVYANNNVAFTSNNQAAAQVSADGSCTDGADDGKLGFGETIGNFFKGLVSPVTSLFESPGNFIKGVAIMAGCAALTVATGGAAAPLLVAGGCALGGFQAVKGVVGAANAKTDAEAKAAWQSIGAGTGAIALSVAGAKSAAKAGGFYEEGMSSLQATKACFTNVGKSASASLEAFTSGEAIANLKTAYAGGKAKLGEKVKATEGETASTTEAAAEGAPKTEPAVTETPAKTEIKMEKIPTDVETTTQASFEQTGGTLKNNGQNAVTADGNPYTGKMTYESGGKTYEAVYKNGNRVGIGEVQAQPTTVEAAPRYEMKIDKVPTDINNTTTAESFAEAGGQIKGNQAFNADGSGYTGRITSQNGTTTYETVYKNGKIVDIGEAPTTIESFKNSGGTFDGNTALNPDGTGYTGKITTTNGGKTYETVYKNGETVTVNEINAQPKTANAPKTEVKIKMDKVPTDINNAITKEGFTKAGGTFDGNTALNPDGTGYTGKITTTNGGKIFEATYKNGEIVNVGEVNAQAQVTIKMNKVPTDINNTTTIESFKNSGGTFDGNTALNADGTGYTGKITQTNGGKTYQTVYKDGNIVDVGEVKPNSSNGNGYGKMYITSGLAINRATNG